MKGGHLRQPGTRRAATRYRLCFILATRLTSGLSNLQ
jgi:hypothetical protein